MATLNLQVSASTDDAGELDTGDTITTNSTILADNVGDQIFARWLSVTLTSADTITAVTLQLYILNTGSDEPNVTIYGEDADNCATATAGSGNNDISNRTRTTASYVWDVADLGVGAGFYSLSGVTELADMLTEVVARAGWASGNAYAKILEALGPATRDLQINSYDFDTSQAPKLDITYTAGGGGGGARRLVGERFSLAGAGGGLAA